MKGFAAMQMGQGVGVGVQEKKATNNYHLKH